MPRSLVFYGFFVNIRILWKHVEQVEPGMFFAREGDRARCGGERFGREVRRVEDGVAVNDAVRLRGDVGSDGEHRTGGMAENAFGDRAHKRFADATAAVGAKDDDIHSIFVNDLGKFLPNVAAPNEGFVRHALPSRFELIKGVLRFAYRLTDNGLPHMGWWHRHERDYMHGKDFRSRGFSWHSVFRRRPGNCARKGKRGCGVAREIRRVEDALEWHVRAGCRSTHVPLDAPGRAAEDVTRDVHFDFPADR